ncbi:hypothetical protein E2C01_059855 [Portunus trituberculatus]|uniref:Uncharacterized protein n=1 Tax=Portunus trituberculatus TaxID=210409 RepID=A0A5B7H7D5_PORTR|nr:hypothetical protein [Portunus trituberculatus]
MLQESVILVAGRKYISTALTPSLCLSVSVASACPPVSHAPYGKRGTKVRVKMPCLRCGQLKRQDTSTGTQANRQSDREGKEKEEGEEVGGGGKERDVSQVPEGRVRGVLRPRFDPYARQVMVSGAREAQ